MVFNKNKQGQAAIEFLMTYGWMLLVVLIVGALIFSFVDFGSLLPNRIELNNNLRASATESFAWNTNSGGPDADIVTMVFTYNGAKRVEIAGTDSEITRDDSSTPCDSSGVYNVDTNINSTDATGVTFLNGQTGYMQFDCSAQPLIAGDVLEGQVRVNVASIKTGLDTPSTGPIRLTIN